MSCDCDRTRECLILQHNIVCDLKPRHRPAPKVVLFTKVTLAHTNRSSGEKGHAPDIRYRWMPNSSTRRSRNGDSNTVADSVFYVLFALRTHMSCLESPS